jgi:hypothetical protein
MDPTFLIKLYLKVFVFAKHVGFMSIIKLKSILNIVYLLNIPFTEIIFLILEIPQSALHN